MLTFIHRENYRLRYSIDILSFQDRLTNQNIKQNKKSSYLKLLQTRPNPPGLKPDAQKTLAWAKSTNQCPPGFLLSIVKTNGCATEKRGCKYNSLLFFV